ARLGRRPRPPAERSGARRPPRARHLLSKRRGVLRFFAPGGGVSGVEAALQALGAARLVAVLRADSGERACQLVEAVIDGGIRAVEVTLTVPEAEDVIRWAGQRFGASVQVGAGSVLDAAAARRVIAAGARFVVSPILDAGVLDACRGAGVLGVPGCFTPTEI